MSIETSHRTSNNMILRSKGGGKGGGGDGCYVEFKNGCNLFGGLMLRLICDVAGPY